MIHKPCSEIYSLDDLLPAGTVQFYLRRPFENFLSECALESSQDYSEWETLEPLLESAGDFSTPQQSRFIELKFLTKHNIIRSQWKSFGCHLLHIRIYLIPSDHPTIPKRIRSKRLQNTMSEAKRYLVSLLSYTNRASIAWDKPVPTDDKFDPFLSTPEDILLTEIYSNLPSPKVHPSTFLKDVDPRIRKHYLRVLTCDKPPGMVSTLYKYQARTVASMLEREVNPGVMPDPSYVPLRGVRGYQDFYLQPASMDILRGPLPSYTVPSGGILCEEMGTGKTCIILGLLVATKDRLSEPEEEFCGEFAKCALTELALRNFPFLPFKNARELTGQEISSQSFPSLKEILFHYIKTSPLTLSPSDRWKLEATHPHFHRSLQNCVPFYYTGPTNLGKSSRITGLMKRGWRQFFLTSATLILVPQAIITQWESEIHKHCDSSIIRVFCLNDSNKAQKIPPAPKLASDYDIILLTHEGFSRQANSEDLTRRGYCQCPTDGFSVAPECFCKLNESSPLLQIRWKRLVIDEGHKTGTRTNFALKCQELNVQHRWIVTGTPTPNLMGLGLGKAEQCETSRYEDDGDGEHNDNVQDVDDENEPPAVNDQYDKDNDADVDEGNPDDEEYCLRYPYDMSIPQSRPWTKEERADLIILGAYISNFFRFSPYLHKNEFYNSVINPVMHETGPLFGSVAILRNIMTLFMFRHRIQDVESDIPEKFPVLEEKIVKLKFQPLAARTYNVLQSLIAVNAVDSRREHQDYLFHPSSRKDLRTALDNLSQTLFWKVDSEVFDIQEAIARSKNAEAYAIERKVSASDLQLVRESLRIQQDANDDEMWKAIMSNEDHVYSLHGLSELLYYAWSKLNIPFRTGHDQWFDAERLLAMQKIIRDFPYIPEFRLADRAQMQIDVEQEWQSYLNRPRKGQYRRRKHAEKASKLIKFSQDIACKTRDRPRRTEFQKSNTSDSEPEKDIPHIYIRKSASSKVNYILRKVLKHASKHKFLIFSSMPLSLAYLADALRLAQVPFLSYISTGMNPRQRRKDVITFETSQNYRVLLVELKLGARGLNLTSASRIIFCEPVWHGDVESQAIKRAHRIGQKCRKVKVVTLVMKGTYEEAMVSRRRALQNQVQQQATSFELDVSMRRVLENTTFITDEYVEASDSNLMEIPLGKQYDVVEVRKRKNMEKSPTQSKKMKTVHFTN